MTKCRCAICVRLYETLNAQTDVDKANSVLRANMMLVDAITEATKQSKEKPWATQ